MNTSVHHQDDFSKEPSVMEQEISHTRERIGRTVEELEQRLSPGQLVDQALRYARDHGGHVAADIAGSIRRNPLPMLVTGLGVMWLLKSHSSHASHDSGPRIYTPYDHDDASFDAMGTSSWGEGHAAGGSGGARSRIAERLSGVGEAIKSRVAGARSSAASAGESVSEPVRSAKTQLTGKTQGALGSSRTATRAVWARVGHARHSARIRAHRAKEEFSALMEEQPLLMGAIGVAIGATIAALVPGTRREKEMMGRASDTVADKAGELASQGYENLRETASQSVNEFTNSLGRESESDDASRQGAAEDAISAGMSKAADRGVSGPGLT